MTSRLLPNADLGNRHLGAVPKLLPTVPKQVFRDPKEYDRVSRESRGPLLRLLPTSGVVKQHLGASLRLLLTAGVGDPRVSISLRKVSQRVFRREK